MIEKPPGLRVVAIAAMARNRVIGSGNRLPWHLPDDLKWFKKCTLGKTLLMGRKTFDSIGRALVGRRLLVLSRAAGDLAGATVVRDLSHVADALTGEKELWVAGGSQVYELTRTWWDELLLTRVKMEPEGDAYFPRFEDRMQKVEILQDDDQMTIERHVRAIMVA